MPDTRTGKELREWEFSNRLATPRRRRSLLGTGLRYTGGSGNSSWLQRVSAGAVVWLPCARGNRELKAKAEAVGSTVRMWYSDAPDSSDLGVDGGKDIVKLSSS